MSKAHPLSVFQHLSLVRTRNAHHHVGLVTEVHTGCPESEAWIRGQKIPFTKNEIEAEYWVSIMVLGGGSVCSPCLYESLELLADKDEVGDQLRLFA